MKKAFDDIIRKRWENRHFTVDDTHRQEMIALLEGKKRRRAFPFWWWGAGAVVVAAVGYLWIVPVLPTVSDTAGEPAVHSGQTQKDAASLASPETSDAPAYNISGEESNASNVKVDTRHEINAINTDETLSSPTNTVNKPPASRAKAADNPPAPSKPAKREKAFTSVPSEPPTISKPDNRDEAREEIIAHVGHTVQKGEVNEASPNPQEGRLTNDGHTNEPGNPADVLDKGTVPFRGYVHIASLAALPVEYLQGIGREGIRSIEPGNRIPNPLYSFAEAGLGAVLASKPDYDAGIKINIGAGLGYRLQPRLHLMWSAGYLLQEGGFDFERTSTVNQAGFGVRSQFNSLSPDRLHFVYSKAGVQYRKQKHVFAGGLGLQYLYGAQGHIQVQTTDQITESTLSTSRYVWLNTDGIRRWQWNAALSYGYRITPRLLTSVGSQFYFTTLEEHDPSLQDSGYYWNGTTAKLQPFITINYLLYDLF